MDQQFSPGLLYSVAPENFSELHLQDEDKTATFEWEKQETAIDSLIRIIHDLLAKPAEQ